MIISSYYPYRIVMGARGSVVVKALCYKQEGPLLWGHAVA
jgi:hypothetical protein